MSVIGLLIGNFIENKYIGLLGLFPIYLGLKQIAGWFKNNHSEENVLPVKENKNGFLKVATVTFANGGDNIGTYIPLFAVQTRIELSLMILLFLIMVLVWLLIANYLSKHPHFAKTIGKYGHIITPIVLVGIGIYILFENGSFGIFR